MASLHRVQQGDTLVDIAMQYGFTDCTAIWDHAKNALLKRQRPNPNLLYPGDFLFIPDKQGKIEQRNTTQRHIFQLRSATKMLRIALEDEEGHRIANTRYALKIGPQLFPGTTDGQGMLQQEIPVEAQGGELIVQQHAWPLEIGHLNPVEHAPDRGVSGIQARLRNLGYYQGEIDLEMDESVRAAIRAFQEDHGLPVDGACDPGSATFAKLIQKHGC